MAIQTEPFETVGPAGRIDCLVDWPDPAQPLLGWALVLHPHPLHGGTRNNKVVTTLSRAYAQAGYAVLRPDFRGVGKSEGSFDQAHGETADMQQLVQAFLAAHPQLDGKPWLLAGFSFGTAVAAQLYSVLSDEKTQPLPQLLTLVGTAVKRFTWREVVLPANAVVIHGERDEVVPLQEVFDWITPYRNAVTVIPGATHFFHGYLIELKKRALDGLLQMSAEVSA
ncbi:alpha/beta hydrolase [Advenella mimigardefordensis]|uniref:Putative alpha/beta-hydrolase fold domain-containing protein n=1 Tax=Advenella mimigardefordensis (strain DSM 17166 / LMG 22922 / DPN7) TaxID=1247726 RepID=W0PBI2_ADVMD|nr:alpha/beta fold hydrolase [Advenella mimigardefordensis]AHG62775.1 putative alpha/beta-hydrolase fold domain-containing protein [Advenella mimigardefordensis DPN7]